MAWLKRIPRWALEALGVALVLWAVHAYATRDLAHGAAIVGQMLECLGADDGVEGRCSEGEARGVGEDELATLHDGARFAQFGDVVVNADDIAAALMCSAQVTAVATADIEHARSRAGQQIRVDAELRRRDLGHQ